MNPFMGRYSLYRTRPEFARTPIITDASIHEQYLWDYANYAVYSMSDAPSKFRVSQGRLSPASQHQGAAQARDDVTEELKCPS
jgi:hypothetical protein